MHAKHDIVTANLSVRLSVTRWYRIETNADIVQLFPPPGMSMILVFSRPTAVTKFLWKLPRWVR